MLSVGLRLPLACRHDSISPAAAPPPPGHPRQRSAGSQRGRAHGQREEHGHHTDPGWRGSSGEGHEG